MTARLRGTLGLVLLAASFSGCNCGATATLGGKPGASSGSGSGGATTGSAGILGGGTGSGSTSGASSGSSGTSGTSGTAGSSGSSGSGSTTSSTPCLPTGEYAGNASLCCTNLIDSSGYCAGPPAACGLSSKSTDAAGCSCASAGATRSCYPNNVPASTRGVGACHDGTQTCQGSGELQAWGPCQGAVTPAQEICNDGVDNDCDGLVDCADPSCAQDPACTAACTDGATRPCYDGPSSTENVGLCKDGVQTCVNGQWSSTCAGEVLPTAESCCDALDHNCNGLPGCLDVFSCLTNGCCQAQCATDAGPGCVCPQGQGDTATCPDGMVGLTLGGSTFSPLVACCPCTANDCGNAGCCGESVCAGSSQCSSLTCKPLPASCNGQVNFDCDDFPEDCDEPCCKCTSCP